jgi:PAS domain S-box-containing protein
MPHTQLLFESIFATTRDAIYVTDEDYRCVMVNQAFCDLTGYTQKELIGKKVASLLVDDMDESMYQQISESINSYNDLSLFESRWRHKNGAILPVEIRHAVLTNAAGDYAGIVLFVRDITERKAIFEHLMRSHEQLQEKVRERTVNLEEINTALRVVLQDREEEHKTNEDSMQGNVNQLVLPYLNRLKTTRLDERQRALIALIESTLKDIIAPFTGRPALRSLSLTPSELQIANMIRQGMTAKEIAVITSLSPDTITCIRSNIRKKLGLVNSKVNLRTYLLSSG